MSTLLGQVRLPAVASDAFDRFTRAVTYFGTAARRLKFSILSVDIFFFCNFGYMFIDINTLNATISFFLLE